MSPSRLTSPGETTLILCNDEKGTPPVWRQSPSQIMWHPTLFILQEQPVPLATPNQLGQSSSWAGAKPHLHGPHYCPVICPQSGPVIVDLGAWAVVTCACADSPTVPVSPRFDAGGHIWWEVDSCCLSQWASRPCFPRVVALAFPLHDFSPFMLASGDTVTFQVMGQPLLTPVVYALLLMLMVCSPSVGTVREERSDMQSVWWGAQHFRTKQPEENKSLGHVFYSCGNNL